MANSVYATHRIVKNLESDLAPRVTQLNETAADLSAKVSASEVATRELRTMIEEQQAKLNLIQQNLDSLSRVVYQEFQRTPVSGTAPGSAGSAFERATVQPPPAQTPIPGGAQPATPSSVIPGAPAPGTATMSEPTTPLAEYNRAQESFLNEDYERALGLYSEYLAKYPAAENVDNAQFWKAECYKELGRYEEAIREYETLRSNYPANRKIPRAMLHQAECHEKLGQIQRAVDLLQLLTTDERYAAYAEVEPAKVKLRELTGR